MNELKIRNIADKATEKNGIVYYVIKTCKGFDLIAENKWKQWENEYCKNPQSMIKPKYVYKTEKKI